MKKGYKKTIDLKHSEIPAAIDTETGLVRPITAKTNNIPEGKVSFGKEEIGWRKAFNHSWYFLKEKLSHLEISIVLELCLMAKLNTNSLEPLNDDTTLITIATMFSIDHRKTNKIFKKLYELGVYARFDVAREDVPYTKYWILNPYLSFGGALIYSDIADLFLGTKLTNEYYKRLNEEKKTLKK